MIIDINFLPGEHQLKIVVKKLIIMSCLALFVGIVLISGISGFLKYKINQKQKEINVVEKSIKDTKAQIVSLEKEIDGIPDLTSKIKIVEDILMEKNLRFSEFLYVILSETPNEVWFTDLQYKDDKIILQGVAKTRFKKEIRNGEDYWIVLRKPELIIYDLERSLLDSGKFTTVRGEYVKDTDVKGHGVNNFMYELTIRKDNIKLLDDKDLEALEDEEQEEESNDEEREE